MKPLRGEPRPKRLVCKRFPVFAYGRQATLTIGREYDVVEWPGLYGARVVVVNDLGFPASYSVHWFEPAPEPVP